MKKIFILSAALLFAISCHVPVHHDYQGTSKSLVFTQKKKWLINNMYSDLSQDQRETLNSDVFETFERLSNGNATRLTTAQRNALLPGKISFSPSLEEIQSLSNSDYDYLVNVYTKKVHDQIGNVEIDRPLQYSKNEAFAEVEVYDLKTSKRIYFQKASSMTNLEGKKLIENRDYTTTPQKQPKEGPFLNYSASQLSAKNLKKILKDIEKYAVK